MNSRKFRSDLKKAWEKLLNRDQSEFGISKHHNRLNFYEDFHEFEPVFINYRDFGPPEEGEELEGTLGIIVGYEGDNSEFIIIPSNAKISDKLIEFHVIQQNSVIPAIIPLEVEKELFQLADFWAINYKYNTRAVRQKLKGLEALDKDKSPWDEEP